jgi:Pro-kumamolisin, activation domain/Bacterial Ig-like domain (group 3)
MKRPRLFPPSLVSSPGWKSLVAVILLLMVAAGFSSRHAMAQAPDMTRLTGHTPNVVIDGTAKFVGHYNPNQMVRLVIGLQPPHMAEEEQFLEELQTKGSPQFHHFLTAEEWNARFAPSAQDEQAVVDWATAQGLTPTYRYPNRLLVDVEAPIAMIEKAFNVTINSYQLNATTTSFSNDRDPAIPASLAGIIHSVGGLNNLQLLHPANKAAAEPDFPVYVPGPAVATGPTGGGSGDRKKLLAALAKSQAEGPTPGMTSGAYDPTDIYSSEAYDTRALYNQGHCCNPLGNPGSTPPETSIAIATAGTQNPNDFQGFHNQYPYLAWHYQLYYIDGTPSCCDGEGTMDFEWSTAMSNSFGSFVDTSLVYMYDGVNSNFSTFTDIYNRVLSDGKARVFSSSWGCAEIDCTPTSVMDTDHAIFNAMIGQGWTLVGIAHDGGATAPIYPGGVHMCPNHDAVSYPGSDPNFVSGGGTQLSLFSGPVFNSEVTWTGGPAGCTANDGGGGGGNSAYWPSPSYQGSVYPRQVPDIALNADWYYTPQNIFFNGSLSGNGGTSIVAPEVAGFFANENSYLLYLSTITGGLCNGHTCAPIGNPNIYLYYFGNNPGYAPHYPFYDITSGCNNNDITALYGLAYYCASVGRDLATGWGSFNMFELAWAINTYQAGDFGAPVVSFSGPLANHWYNSDQVVSWTVADTSSDGLPPTGVAGFSQAWDSDPGDVFSEPTPGSGNSFYSGPQYPNATSGCLDFAGASCAGSVGQGWHTVNVRAWDNTGFTANYTYGPVGYDTITPITGHGQSPAANGSGWNKSSVNVTLSAFDPGAPSTGSGVFTTYYNVDNGLCSPAFLSTCIAYGGPFNVTVQGVHTVYFFSRDVAGNFEVRNTATVRIDETAPVSGANLSGTLNGSVYVSPVKVTLSASDNLSGVANTVYQINGGALQTYSGPFNVAILGGNTITFHSADKAGNVETTKTVSFTIKGATTTSVGSSKNPAVLGSPVTFTATVTSTVGTATGTVTFKNGATTLGTGSLVAGKATLTTSSLTPGSHSITAVYGGGADFLASTSPVLTQTVLAVTSTSVIASANPSVFGQTVTFTATVTSVTAGTITGSVTFKDGPSVLASGVISGGKAKFSTSALAVGSHSITGVYSGNAGYATSTSSPLSHTVNKASSSTTVISSHNPSVFGQSVTFTATVAAVAPGSGTPTGTVTFKNGATVLGTGTLSSGKATFSTSALAVGPHSITGIYSGSIHYNTGISAVLTETENKASTSTTVISSHNPSVFGQSVTFTATVAAVAPGNGTPTGTVTFKNGATVLGTAALGSGKATFSTSALAVGSHSITAVYGGSIDYGISTSSVLTQTVNKAASSTTVTSSLNPSTLGKSVTFTITVVTVAPGSGTPTGTVTLKNGATTVGTAALASGKTTISTSALIHGAHPMTAVYSGSADNLSGTSAILTQTVN